MIVWKLDELMRLRGIKGRELARRMNIGENYLSRVRHEVPDRLSLTLLDALCRELGCGIGDLLEYKVVGRARKAAPKPAVEATAVSPAPTPAEPSPADEYTGSAFMEDVLAPLFAELGPAAGIVEQAMAPEPLPTEAAGVMAVAPVAEPAPEPEPEAEATPAGGSAVLRTSALQARLERLKRARNQP